MEKFITTGYFYDPADVERGELDAIHTIFQHEDLKLVHALTYHTVQIWSHKIFKGSKATTWRTNDTINTIITWAHVSVLEIQTTIIQS